MIYEEDARRKTIENQISLLRDAAAFTSRLKPIIGQFDGKIYNCKFDDALKTLSNENDYISVYNQYGWFYIDYMKKGYYSTRNTLISGYSCKAADHIEKQDKPDCIIFDGKKIIAEKMINSLNNSRERLLKKAYDLETAYNNIDGIISQIEHLKTAYRAITSNLPDVILDSYGIKRYAL